MCAPYAGDILIVTFLINVITTGYYGWTMEASTKAEEYWDVFCSFGYLLGICLFFQSYWNVLLDIQEELAEISHYLGMNDVLTPEPERDRHTD